MASIIGRVLANVSDPLISSEGWNIPAILGEKTCLGLSYGVFGRFSNGLLLAIRYANIGSLLQQWVFVVPFTFISSRNLFPKREKNRSFT